jgi:pimeloyl-ACP methyl ester carboxylesterase/DNA-binding winged helix-turn-helix (wHTH) protein/class 3 adenylate cyclase
VRETGPNDSALLTDRGSVAFPPFRLDTTNECLWRGSERIELTPKAFAVLRRLLEAAGHLVTKDQLLNSVWAGTFVGDAVLKVCIGEIRRALCDEPRAPRFIETLHRRGYRFIAPVETSAPPAPWPATADVKAELSIPKTRYARSGDVNIAYQVLGDGPLDLVFVMGWVSHLEYFWTEPSFAQFLMRLASFSRLILFDKRGTGLSDRVPISQMPTLEQRMDDVRAVMEAVGSERAAICGVSEGGIMSALFAATYPAKTLALIMMGVYAKRTQGAGYPWGPSLSQREEFYQEILTKWGGPIGLEERAPSVASDPRFREWWATYLRMGASPGAALTLTKMNAAIDVRDVLKNIRVPTLVLHRTDDRCLRVEEGRYAASLIPGARFVEVPGCDHLPFVGDQNSMLDRVEEFLLGAHQPEELNRVLATVLSVSFPQAAVRGEGAIEADEYELLCTDLRREIEWFRGREIHIDSRGGLALFDGPARAIRCACAIAERASWLGLKIAAGLHTGECDCLKDGPSGPAVDTAFQIASAAGPGEIMVSTTVRDLVAGSGISFTEAAAFAPPEGAQPLPLFRVERPSATSAHAG